MKVKILRDIKVLLSDGRHRFAAGDIANLPENDALHLIDMKAAEHIKETKKKIVKPEPKE